MMTHYVCLSIVLLLLLCFVINDARQIIDPLQGTSSACIDACTSSEAHVELDLSIPRIYRENQLVQVQLHHTGSGRCREPALLKIPLDTLGAQGVVKLELDFGPVLHNFTLDIGTDPAINDDIIRSVNVFNQQISIRFRTNSFNSTSDDQVDINEQSVILLEPGSHLTLYLSNEWIHIENNQRLQQALGIKFNRTGFLFSSKQLFIGLNRNLAGNQTGIGLCSANLTLIQCSADSESALDIDVNKKTFEQRDRKNITWISHLSYLDPNADIRECTAQGVVRLTFDPNGPRRIARFDLNMGSQVQGFTFNIGDSATNNGYGGDGGTTSNSAEIHSNDNRFYIWANTKICGDTLLLKIDYNVIEPFDNITILVSNERIELTNHRSYHQILRSPYLYALAGQNVTCNCFDSLCYPGVQPDNDVYFGINRVIGGTYRPGIGVCNATVNWIQCKKIDVSPRIKYESISTSIPSTTVTPQPVETTTSMMTFTTEIPTTESKSFEQSTESQSSSAPETVFHDTEMTHTENYPYSITTESSTLTTIMDFQETTLPTQTTTTTVAPIFTTDQTTFIQLNQSEATTENLPSSTVFPSTVEEQTTISAFTNYPHLFRLLANLTQWQSTDNNIMTSSDDFPTSTSLTGTNPCTFENLRANFVYHEYPLDKHKFIFCDSESKMNIIACSPDYIWSQIEQSCIKPN